MAITVQTIYDETRRLTRTNSNTLVNADLLLLTNDSYLEIQRELARNKIEVYGLVATASLVASQEDYAMPADCFEIVHMEINYDDPTDYTKWRKMTPSDLPNLPVTWQQFVRDNTTSSPEWDTFGGQFYVAPRPPTNEAAGLKLWYIQKKADFTAVTDNVVYPLTLFWQLFPYCNTWKYWLPFNDTEAAKFKALFDTEMAKAVDNLKDENVEPIKTRSVDYYNKGWM